MMNPVLSAKSLFQSRTSKGTRAWRRYATIRLVAVLLGAIANGSSVNSASGAPSDGTSAPGGSQQEKHQEASEGQQNERQNGGTEESQVRFDPVVRQIEGWTVYAEPALIDGKHKQMGARALSMLGDHLRRISVLVTGKRLKKLKRMEIWIEHHHPKLGAMQYHPSIDWLKKQGHDPRLAKKVHITRAETLLSRHQMIKHPWVVLHELAHAYHDQYLGFDDPEVKKTYQEAEKEGIYENVLLYTGQRVRHYGLTDHKEYFAEGTEAYLARNDFYPFVRAELKEHDPRLHDLLKKIWGPVP